MGGHGGAACGICHGEIHASMGNAQGVHVLRFHGFGDPGVAGADLLHKDAKPLGIGVVGIAVVLDFLIVHRTALLNQMV